MIRLIQRRLIIPCGDTGTLKIPVLANKKGEGVAVFSIINPITQGIIFQKEIYAEDNILTVNFSHNETVDLPAGRYVWDIKYYVNPVYDNGIIIDGDEVNSYYAGFGLPVCEIKRTSDNFSSSTSAIKW